MSAPADDLALMVEALDGLEVHELFGRLGARVAAVTTSPRTMS